MRYFIVLLLTLLGLQASPVSTNTLMPNGDWSSAGVEGGIPTISTMYWNVATSQPSITNGLWAKGDGVTDDYIAIQTSLNKMSSSTYNYYPAGTYIITNMLLLSYTQTASRHHLLLKGDGKGKTIFAFNLPDNIATNNVANTPYAMLKIESDDSFYGSGFETSITTDGATLPRGNTTCTVANAANVHAAVGYYVLVDHTQPWYCTTNWGDSGYYSRSGGQRMEGWITKLSGVSGNNLTFDRASPWAYTNTPQVVEVIRGSTFINYIGVEGITFTNIRAPSISASNSTFHGIYIKNMPNVWIKDCEITRWGSFGVYVKRSCRCSILGNWIHEASGPRSYHGNQGPGQGYGVEVGYQSTDIRVENNAFGETRHAMPAESCGAGNVYAYNFSYRVGDQNSPSNNYVMGDMTTHGAGCHLLLYEGNAGRRMFDDEVHGTSSYITYLRNHALGQSFGHTNAIDEGRWCIEISAHNYFENYLGNICGKYGVPGLYKPANYPDFDWFVSCVKLGWPNGYFIDSQTPTIDNLVASRAVIHRTYFLGDNSIHSETGGGDTDVPVSYLGYSSASKPSYWPSTLPFPPVDVSGANGYVLSKLPAQLMVEKLGEKFTSGFGVGPPASGTATTYKFTNSSLITIPTQGAATPYPSTITVAGVPGVVTNINVTVTNFWHTGPHDVQVALESPDGTQTILWSECGWTNAVQGVSLQFSSAAGVTNKLFSVHTAGSNILSGLWYPTDGKQVNHAFTSPVNNQDLYPYLDEYRCRQPNGVWKLYVYDALTGDGGAISNGWSISITTDQAATAGTNVWYVDTAGTPQGLGTIGSPRDLTSMCDPATTLAHGGDTILINAGTYSAPYWNVGGSNYTTKLYIQATSGRAIIDGQSIIGPLCTYTVFRNLEFTDSGKMTKPAAPYATINDAGGATGVGNEFWHCIIHDVRGGITGKVAERAIGNLIYYYGTNALEHGIYFNSQTSGVPSTNEYYQNIILDGAGHGIQGYGGTASTNYILGQNVIFGTEQLLGNPQAGVNSITIGGGGPIKDLYITNNYVYETNSSGIKGILVGYGSTSNYSATVNSNWVFSGTRGLYFANKWSTITNLANTVVGGGANQTMGFSPADANTITNTGKYNWDRNAYYNNSATNRFELTNNSVADLPTLRSTTGFDTTGTATGTSVPGAFVSVLRSPVDTNRATVVIWNPSRSTTVNADLVNFASIGDAVTWRNAENYFSDTNRVTNSVNTTYTFPMTGHSVATPVGYSAPSSYFPQWGVFLLERTAAQGGGGGGGGATTGPGWTNIFNQVYHFFFDR